MKKNYDFIVVGAGAAGMMAAGTAAQQGLRVCLLEKNERPGRKIMITGKGRCNVTNHCDVPSFISFVPSNGKFLYGAISRFAPEDTMRFFEDLGVKLKVERGNRVFPESDKAVEIVDALVSFVKKSGVEIVYGTAQDLLVTENAVCGVRLQDGRQIHAKKVLLACGGASYPGTGSTGDGYRLARQVGHTVTKLRPSLVALTAQGSDCREMMGLSLKNIAISVTDEKKHKEVYHDFGEMLFTHFGISGPVVLSASTHLKEMAPGRYCFHIDLKPALSVEQLDARIQRDFAENQNRDFVNSLNALLPRKLIPVAVRRSGIVPETKCNQVTKEQRAAFVQLLKNFTVDINGFRPIEEAIVTAGGVSVKEVSPKTMESKQCKGLYFAGEILDVDGYTGGFNLQIAFCTGRMAGLSAAEEQ